MLWPTVYRESWNPWTELDRVNRQFNRAFGGYGDARDAGEFPAVDVWGSDETVLLTAEIPGIDPAKIEITVKNDTVTIRGNREAEALAKGETYLRQERGRGSFVRSFALPFAVDSDSVTARYEKGVLEIRLERHEQDKPRKISVEAA